MAMLLGRRKRAGSPRCAGSQLRNAGISRGQCLRRHALVLLQGPRMLSCALLARLILVAGNDIFQYSFYLV
ncbi:hypothetical protein CEY08_07545 [Achromobacter insolitus]|nr:hypothetical protein CEY08_07545 [Achromobacter insolitus]